MRLGCALPAQARTTAQSRNTLTTSSAQGFALRVFEQAAGGLASNSSSTLRRAMGGLRLRMRGLPIYFTGRQRWSLTLLRCSQNGCLLITRALFHPESLY